VAGANPHGVEEGADTLVQSLKDLFRKTFAAEVESMEAIRQDGSDRNLFRLTGGGHSVVGVSHADHRENAAFVGFSRHFHAIGLPVPEILAVSPDEGVYLETDLGRETLAERIAQNKNGGGSSDELRPLYEKAIRTLPHFQVRGHQGIDYSLCYQHQEFAPHTAEDDLRYFRECFLDLIYEGPRDDDGLDADFNAIVKDLAAAPSSFFLYRDFQVRNIMVVGDDLYFIDYQSGRRGALQYDLAAFLYSSRSGLGKRMRRELFDMYIEEVSTLTTIDASQFRGSFPAFSLIRILQALGAYGNLGINRGKKRFLKGIPGALENLNSVMGESNSCGNYPALCDIFKRVIESPDQYLKVPYNE